LGHGLPVRVLRRRVGHGRRGALLAADVRERRRRLVGRQGHGEARGADAREDGGRGGRADDGDPGAAAGAALAALAGRDGRRGRRAERPAGRVRRRLGGARVRVGQRRGARVARRGGLRRREVLDVLRCGERLRRADRGQGLGPRLDGRGRRRPSGDGRGTLGGGGRRLGGSGRGVGGRGGGGGGLGARGAGHGGLLVAAHHFTPPRLNDA